MAMRKNLIALIIALGALLGNALPTSAATVAWSFFSFYRDLSLMTGSFVYDSTTGTFSNVSFRYRFGRQFGPYNNARFNVVDPSSAAFVLTLFPNGIDPTSDLTGLPYLEIDAADFGNPASTLEFTVIGTCLSPSCVGTLGTDFGSPETLGGFAFLRGRASAASVTAAPIIASALGASAAPVAPVPLPAPGLLLGGTVAALLALSRRRKRLA